MNEEEMNVGELLKETAEENQTRKILEILNECGSLEEAKEKVKALLKKQSSQEKSRAELATARHHRYFSIYMAVLAREKR